MRVQFCSCCARIIDFEFNFCPWCGIAAHESPDFSRTRDRTLAKACGERDPFLGRMNRMDRSLEELEKDLDVLIEREEQEKH